jgi:hypothetical protein
MPVWVRLLPEAPPLKLITRYWKKDVPESPGHYNWLTELARRFYKEPIIVIKEYSL